MNAIHFIIKSEFCDRKKHCREELIYGNAADAHREAQKRFDKLHSRGCSNIHRQNFRRP